MAAEMERQGISTVSIQLLREVALKMRPPRSLFVPFRHGYPLEAPGEPAKQRAVLEAALRLLEMEEAGPPLLADLDPAAN